MPIALHGVERHAVPFGHPQAQGADERGLGLDVRCPSVAILPRIALSGGGEHLRAVGDAVVCERLRLHEFQEFVGIGRSQVRSIKVNAFPVCWLLQFHGSSKTKGTRRTFGGRSPFAFTVTNTQGPAPVH